MNILAVDAGNTSVSFGIFRGEDKSIARSIAVRGGVKADRDGCLAAVRDLLDFSKQVGGIGRAMISSVTPSFDDALADVVRLGAKMEPRFVRWDMPMPVKLDIPEPETMGADRIADLVATSELYGRPAVIIDIGTAVTYDLLSEDGRFFAGVIGPGPEIIAKSLNDYTALLPYVEWWKKDPPECPVDTEGAILFGVCAGFAGMVRETADRIARLIEGDVRRIATGGFADRFLGGMGYVIDRDLTLKGVGLLAL